MRLNRTLHTLNLKDNNLRDECGEAFADISRLNIALTGLNLD